jgi:lysozyme
MPVPTFCRRAVIVAAFAVSAASVAGCTNPAGPARPIVAPPAAGLPRWPVGIDVSSHQHPAGKAIDWATVARAGISFAFVKVDEGARRTAGRYVNPYFKADWDGARNAGIIVGPYHYARPRRPVSATADGDARQFVATVGSSIRTAGLPPVLDLEEPEGLSGPEIVTWARQWLATVTALTGRTPVVYTAVWYWSSYLGGSTDLAQHPLWLARYSDTPGFLPGGWGTWSFWQFSAKGRVPGIDGDVDLNQSCGRVVELVNECKAPSWNAWAAALNAASRPRP